MSGPTYFAPIIREALTHARKLQGRYAYAVLLILTDGEIHDMNETKNLIVENAFLPISIVIVGIGSANFDKMSDLDGDNGLYSSTGKKSPRDIVQFVPFNKYQGNADLLTKELLKEIPSQVVQYFVILLLIHRKRWEFHQRLFHHQKCEKRGKSINLGYLILIDLICKY